MKQQKRRPKFLNLLKIHLPITGIASINHRISGVILFLAIPLSLYFFQLSLSGQNEFNEVMNFLSSWWLKIAFIPLLWAFSHHLLAGFRFLLIDQNIGVSLINARRSAWLVTVLAVVITLGITGVCLL